MITIKSLAVVRQFPGRCLVERGPHDAKLQNGHTDSLFLALANQLKVSNPGSLSMD